MKKRSSLFRRTGSFLVFLSNKVMYFMIFSIAYLNANVSDLQVFFRSKQPDFSFLTGTVTDYTSNFVSSQ